MSFKNIPSGNDFPNDIFSIIEISSGFLYPVKYELNHKYDVLFVDRFINIPISYPCNYGYINKTLSQDNDPLDVLVMSCNSLIPYCVINTRPIGLLKLIDESGEDFKILSVPNYNISDQYNHIQDINDVSKDFLNKISFFFENYKYLDKNKWVENYGWDDVHKAKDYIISSYKRYKLKFSI